jgi:hypothetical protein
VENTREITKWWNRGSGRGSLHGTGAEILDPDSNPAVQIVLQVRLSYRGDKPLESDQGRAKTAETFCHSALCDLGGKKKHCFWKALRLGLFFLLKLAGRGRRSWRIGGMTLTGGNRTH